MRRNWCSAVHSALLCASRTISIGASAASAPRSCSWPSERGGGNPAGSCCCMLCKPAALDEPIGPATMLLRWFPALGTLERAPSNPEPRRRGRGILHLLSSKDWFALVLVVVQYTFAVT